jgi:aminoglycoside phosphotransferase family enzyme
MDRALQHACTYAHPAGRLVRVETHISVVYLAGRYAYKICKPVNLGFVDFTTRDARFRCCRDALRLNHRLAPSVYLAVVPIRRTGATFKVGGIGTPFDHALKMRRFDERDTFSALLAHRELRAVDIDRIAARLGSFHVQASRHAPSPAYGSAARISEQCDSVLAALDRKVPLCIPCGVVKWCREEIARRRAHFDMRRREGFVRECHGDLHLSNMVRQDNDVAFFDCIEFNADLRWIDVTADIAFVVMDLLAHERGDLATRFLNRWLTSTGDFDGGLLGAFRFAAIRRVPGAREGAGDGS